MGGGGGGEEARPGQCYVGELMLRGRVRRITMQGLCSAGGRRRPLRSRQVYNTTKCERDRNKRCMIS